MVEPESVDHHLARVAAGDAAGGDDIGLDRIADVDGAGAGGDVEEQPIAVINRAAGDGAGRFHMEGDSWLVGIDILGPQGEAGGVVLDQHEVVRLLVRRVASVLQDGLHHEADVDLAVGGVDVRGGGGEGLGEHVDVACIVRGRPFIAAAIVDQRGPAAEEGIARGGGSGPEDGEDSAVGDAAVAFHRARGVGAAGAEVERRFAGGGEVGAVAGVGAGGAAVVLISRDCPIGERAGLESAVREEVGIGR